MAKATEVEASLFEAFTPEELAEMTEITGQSANMMDRVPILKVNYCDIADKAGRSIKKGNFVLAQNTSEIEVKVKDEEGNEFPEIRVEDIGIDLGKAPKITVLTYGFKYAFYPKDKDKKKFCQSQIVFDRNKERAVGQNLGHECSSGTCPHRGPDVGRDDKCPCQWVVFVEVPLEDGEKTKAVMYVKGDSYMPFNDFTKGLKTTPTFFAPTKITTKMEREGQVTYFVIGWEFQEKALFPVPEARRLRDLAKSTREVVEMAKRQQQNRQAVRQIAGPNEGKNARLIEDVMFDPADDIAF